MGDPRRFWLGLAMVKGIGPGRARALLEHFGSPRSVWQADAAELARAKLPDRVAQSLLVARDKLDLQAELAAVEAAGYQLLTWDDDAYPRRLREIHSPPLVLYVEGEILEADSRAVAIVGTRNATDYGKGMTAEIAGYLAGRGVTIVSGLARGIDGIAHRAALKAGGRSIAVLGSGLDVIYPPEHGNLANQIAEAGGLVSDYPLGTEPEPVNFPPRNRIISGLSLAVIVIEAGARSGALITADFAAEQGREMFALPGRVTSHASVGANRLIRDGAHPLLEPEDVLEVLDMELIARQETFAAAQPAAGEELELLELLAREPRHIDELQHATGRSSADVAAALAMLELKGLVRQIGGMQYIRVREARAMYRVE